MAVDNDEDECCSICLDATFGEPMKEAATQNGNLFSVPLQAVATQPIVLQCGHRFHFGCLRRARGKAHDRCPMCRAQLPQGVLAHHEES